MKTTEIFIEQVITGFMVLAIGAIPFITPEQLQLTSSDIATGAGIVGVAYLLGIIFDRFADTLLGRLEQHNRLWFAYDLAQRKEIVIYGGSDPFPEDLLRAEIMRTGNGAAEWMDYLRTRIRLSRSLAVYLPALTVSVQLAVWPQDQPLWIPAVALAVVAAVYGVAFTAAVFEKWPKLEKLPKTFDPDLERKIKNLNWTREPTVRCAYFATCVGLVLAIVLTWFGIRNPVFLFTVLLAGASLSVLATWTWWRITGTFMQFLYAFKRESLEAKRLGATDTPIAS